MDVVHGAEGYDPPVGGGVVYDAPLNPVQVEVVGVHEMHAAYQDHAMMDVI